MEAIHDAHHLSNPLHGVGENSRVHVDVAGRGCHLIGEISSGSGPTVLPLYRVFSDGAGQFGLETTEAGDPPLSQTPPVLILHLPLFPHSLVYPFGPCPGSVGGPPSLQVTWRLDVDAGDEWPP